MYSNYVYTLHHAFGYPKNGVCMTQYFVVKRQDIIHKPQNECYAPPFMEAFSVCSTGGLHRAYRIDWQCDM